MSPVHYILTTTSMTMFGERATAHIKIVSEREALERIGSETQIVATRESHENMAKGLFGDRRVVRQADMGPEKSAICLIYRGPPVPDSGVVPKGATMVYYLIEVEEYYEEES